jgi:hypothetical protein
MALGIRKSLLEERSSESVSLIESVIGCLISMQWSTEVQTAAHTLIRLYRLEAQPNVNFTVVINPNNGPENTTALDSTWKTNLQQLNKFGNARPIGYVNTNFSYRAIDEVLADSREYASWSYPDANGTYGLTGIYYDQVTANRSTEGAINYGMMLDWMVKAGTAFSPRQLVRFSRQRSKLDFGGH